MQYYSGDLVKLGDKVIIPGGVGTVVAIISDNLFLQGYEFFSYRKTGVLVDIPRSGLTYYKEQPEDDLELIERENRRKID